MEPDQGRLQTGEHILARLLEDELKARIGVCRFEHDKGTMEIYCDNDLRSVDMRAMEKKVQEVIDRDHSVIKYELSRDRAGNITGAGRVPESAENVRIVEIKGFDKRACSDPHVDRTSQIGNFVILKVKKSGRGRFRIYFSVKR